MVYGICYLGIVVIILLAAVLALVFTSNSENITTNSVDTNKSINNTNVISNVKGITLTILEDPTCTSCQVDLFATQVKENLINDLEVTKISIESDKGKAMLAELNLNQVPAYLFSSNIDQRDDWTSKLAPAFKKVNSNGNEFYMLNPQYVPNKVMIEEPKILDSAVVYGNKTAPVTIYEFSDYECPFCGIAEGNADLLAQFTKQSPGYVAPMPEIFKNYIDTGKVKLVFYNMPLESLHPKVRPAHLASMCANEQGKWVEFHHKLFTDRSDWTESADYVIKMKAYAKELGLNQTQFNNCLDTKKYNDQIEASLAYGASLGVSGTPAFFVGKSFLSGAQDYNTFKALIDEQLKATE